VNAFAFVLAVLVSVALFAASPGLALVVGMVVLSRDGKAKASRRASRARACHAWGDW
jgi:hypothetical protein